MSHLNESSLADEKAEITHFENGEILNFDLEAEKRLTKSILRKLDTRMLPMLALLFLFSFLDRCVRLISTV